MINENRNFLSRRLNRQPFSGEGGSYPGGAGGGGGHSGSGGGGYGPFGCQPFPEDIQDMRRRQQGRRTFAQAFDAARPQSSIGGKWYSGQGDLLSRLAKRTPVHKPDIESMKRVEHVKSFDWDANSKKAYRLK